MDKIVYHNMIINVATGIGTQATITVYDAGTATLATIYSTQGGAAKSNPFNTDANGRFNFYANQGKYDIEVSGVGITTYKIENISLVDIIFVHKKPQPLVTFVFDDGTATDYTKMKPLFDSKGEIAVSAIVTDHIGGGYLSWAQIEELYADGWEIASHSKTHTNLTTLNEAQIRAEFELSNQAIEAQGIVVKNFAYPFGAHNSLVRRLASEYYLSARGISGHSNRSPLYTYALDAPCADDHTLLATYQGHVDEAESNNGWLIFYIHGTDDDDVTTIGSLIDYIQGKSIAIVTITQALELVGNVIDVGSEAAIGIKGLRASRIEINEEGMDRLNIGYQAGYPLSISRTINIGYKTGRVNTTGNSVNIGFAAGYNNTTGDSVNIGYDAGYHQTSGKSVNIGWNAGFSTTTGTTVNIGYRAGFSGTTGYTVNIGYDAGRSNTTGNLIAIGHQAGYGVTPANAPITDPYGILIGYNANRSVPSATVLNNYIGIGYGTLIDKSNQVKIGNTNIVETVLFGDIFPGVDDNNYLGKNDDDTPFAWKGVILKDQGGTGKYYRLEVFNDAIRIVDLTD